MDVIVISVRHARTTEHPAAVARAGSCRPASRKVSVAFRMPTSAPLSRAPFSDPSVKLTPSNQLVPSPAMGRVTTFGTAQETASIHTISPTIHSTSPTSAHTDDTRLSTTLHSYHRSSSTADLDSSIDSVWNQDYAVGAKGRRRKGDAALAKTHGSRPGLANEFAVLLSQIISRKPSRQPSDVVLGGETMKRWGAWR